MDPNDQAQQPTSPQPLPPDPPQQQSQDAEWPSLEQQQDAQQQQPIAPESPTSVRDYLAAQGHDVSGYDSDEPLLRDIAAGYETAQRAPSQEQIQRYQQSQPMLQEYAQNAAAFHRWQEEQKAAQPEPEVQPPKWGAPSISERTKTLVDQGMIGRADDGKLGVINAVTQKYEFDQRYATELREADEWANWQTTAHRRLAQDPAGAVWEAGVEDRVGDYLTREEVQERLAEAAAERALVKLQARYQESEVRSLADKQQGFLQSHRSSFLTPGGQLNETGEAYENAYHQARQMFFGSRQELSPEEEYGLFRHASRESLNIDPDDPVEQSGPLAAQQQSTGTPQQVREEKQSTFLGKARQRNGRQQPVNRVFDERPTTVATEAARESARDDLTDDTAWEIAKQEASRDLV